MGQPSTLPNVLMIVPDTICQQVQRQCNPVLIYLGFRPMTTEQAQTVVAKTQTDIFTKAFGWQRAREAQAIGIYPFFTPFDDSEGTIVRAGDREILMLGSNNYL